MHFSFTRCQPYTFHKSSSEICFQGVKESQVQNAEKKSSGEEVKGVELSTSEEERRK